MAALAVVAAFATSAMCSAGTNIESGEQRRWGLEFRTQIEQSGRERPVEVGLAGDWTSTIVAVRSGEYDVALELADVHPTGNAGGNVPREALEQTQRRLSRLFWATYRDDGALLAIHFFKDVDPVDRNLLQMIATAAQFVRPSNEKMVWNAQERDGAGSYLAIYNYADSNTVAKRKLKYVHTDAEPGVPADALHLDVEESEFRFMLDPVGEINTLEGSERVRIGISSADNQFTAIITIRLSNLRKTRAPDLIGSLDRARPEVVSSPIITHKPDPEKLLAQHDSELLEGHTTESLLESATAKKNDDQDLSQRLVAMFRRRPESIPAALAILRKQGKQNRVTDALGAAHMPAAIEALGALARDQASPTPLRIGAISALVLVQHPTIEAMRIPATLLDDKDAQIASAARLMGGAVARAGRNEHPAEAGALDAALIELYRKTQEVGELSGLLAAFGNSAGPAVQPIIEEALHDPRDAVRIAAARALRLAEAPEIDGLLSAAITGDREPQVRAAAIFATSFRRPTSTLTEALMQAAKTDSVEYVRSAAIVQLRAHPQASPAIPETLAWISEHDSKPGIRRLAREGLASAPNSPEQHQGKVSKVKSNAKETRN